MHNYPEYVQRSTSKDDVDQCNNAWCRGLDGSGSAETLSPSSDSEDVAACHCQRHINHVLKQRMQWRRSMLPDMYKLPIVWPTRYLVRPVGLHIQLGVRA